jgi:hypothetical protein
MGAKWKYFFFGLCISTAAIILSFYIFNSRTEIIVVISLMFIISLAVTVANPEKRQMGKWVFLGIITSIPIAFMLLTIILMIVGIH